VKTTLLLSILTMAAIPAAFAQPGPGTDISTAIPIYYGQFVNDIGDVHSNPLHVYSITLAKGQQFSAVLSVAESAPTPEMQVLLYAPGVKTVAAVRFNFGPGNVVFGTGGRSATFSYLVPAAGTYYVVVDFNTVSVSYTLQVTTSGTPQLQALPTQAGCLGGQVDYITYSLQFLALNLPDTISIGGVQACATCGVKAPLYSEMVNKLEAALRSSLPVQACFDATGNIFQISLQHP
jgi:hypothetical protein